MNQLQRQVKGLIATTLLRMRRAGSAALALPGPDTADELIRLCDILLARRGEAWSTATAGEVLSGYARASREERNRFLSILAERYGPDSERLDQAIANYQAQHDAASMAEVHAASESRRQQLIHELNQAEGGTLMLLKMRQEGLADRANIAGFDALDGDFRQVLSSWFNRGFLVLRRIDWSSPASVLRKIIEYEAVHEIQDWDDLRRRVEPPDRRCYAFFHPALVDEPLIFVEVALTRDIPPAIAPILADKREEVDPERATTAVFYSITNCQRGLAGVSFGHFLIKQVVEELSRELGRVSSFVTLSPAPNFAEWLKRECGNAASVALDEHDRAALTLLDAPDWQRDPEEAEKIREPLMRAAAWYYVRGRNRRGLPLDAVARFHLGNGARLERLNWPGDTSPRALQQSYGLMVNYLYDLAYIERNHEAYAQQHAVVAASAVTRLVTAPVREVVPASG